IAHARSARQRRFRLYVPQALAGVEIERFDIAVATGRVGMSLCLGDTETESQDVLAATETRIPRSLHAQARREIRELRGRIDHLVLLRRTGNERAEQHDTQRETHPGADGND